MRSILRSVTAALSVLGLLAVSVVGFTATAGAQTSAINVRIVEQVFNTYGGSLATSDVATTLVGSGE